jgi:hypothetical protein
MKVPVQTIWRHLAAPDAIVSNIRERAAKRAHEDLVVALRGDAAAG